MITPPQHLENVKRMRQLESAGYKFDITADGYSVSLGDRFLGGASVMLPRSKPLHWRHRNANVKNNLSTALVIVDRFLNTP
jgi:hypothetical protein